jgi:choline dehydrogenase
VKKELILSGGAVNSPVMLMVSGIGPKQHLQELRVWLSLNYKLFAFDIKT